MISKKLLYLLLAYGLVNVGANHQCDTRPESIPQQILDEVVIAYDPITGNQHPAPEQVQIIPNVNAKPAERVFVEIRYADGNKVEIPIQAPIDSHGQPVSKIEVVVNLTNEETGMYDKYGNLMQPPPNGAASQEAVHNDANIHENLGSSSAHWWLSHLQGISDFVSRESGVLSGGWHSTSTAWAAVISGADATGQHINQMGDWLRCHMPQLFHGQGLSNSEAGQSSIGGISDHQQVPSHVSWNLHEPMTASVLSHLSETSITQLVGAIILHMPIFSIAYFNTRAYLDFIAGLFGTPGDAIE